MTTTESAVSHLYGLFGNDVSAYLNSARGCLADRVQLITTGQFRVARRVAYYVEDRLRGCIDGRFGAVLKIYYWLVILSCRICFVYVPEGNTTPMPIYSIYASGPCQSCQSCLPRLLPIPSPAGRGSPLYRTAPENAWCPDGTATLPALPTAGSRYPVGP